MANIRSISDIVTPEIHLQKYPQKTPSLDNLAELDITNVEQGNAVGYETLQRRAFSKYHTRKILMPLMDLNNGRKQGYLNTYFCCDELVQYPDGKVTSKYCKNRWCIVCNRIRSAILHNTVKKPLEGVKSCFVLLTSALTKQCMTLDELNYTLDLYYKSWCKVWRNTKNKYGKLKCLRKIEITYSFRDGWFHPHYHIMIEGNSDVGEYVVSEWRRIMLVNGIHTTEKGNGSITANEGAFSEIFKYVCKMYDTVENSNTRKIDYVIPYPAQKLDDIFCALQKRKIFQTYNLGKIEVEEFDDLEATVFTEEMIDDLIFWNWEQVFRTWINYKTGECKTEWKDFTKKELSKVYNSE